MCQVNTDPMKSQVYTSLACVSIPVYLPRYDPDRAAILAASDLDHLVLVANLWCARIYERESPSWLAGREGAKRGLTLRSPASLLSD
ncbi:hypothetical protein WH47_06123 [Habropoda laboriosa]|uniref:Uncharacterized protein n=1 Tax=Habropoda laboriosa TaxID=597456 RepID=A0A0L7QRW4_9HYME|nr:hypothetical protein WH47_06123 [Habropoda laboriosa]